MNENAIYRKLVEIKIATIQLDPYSFCDSQCWFCPHGHIPNPRIYRKHMPVDLLEHILGQFVRAKGSMVADNFRHIWTGHYNEIMLYEHFEVFLKLLKKYDLCTTILSNGLNFTEENTNLISKAMESGVVVGICLNIPAGDPDGFQKYTGQSPERFRKMVYGVQTLLSKLPEKFLKAKGRPHPAVSVQVNGVDDSYPSRLIGPEAPVYPPGELSRHTQLLGELFPQAKVFAVGALFDRAGLLTTLGVFQHHDFYTQSDEVVVGCAISQEEGERPFGWAHINSLGELFLCCCDYSFAYTFGSLATSSLSDIWFSKDHVKMIMKAHDGICRTCCSALKRQR